MIYGDGNMNMGVQEILDAIMEEAKLEGSACFENIKKAIIAVFRMPVDIDVEELRIRLLSTAVYERDEAVFGLLVTVFGENSFSPEEAADWLKDCAMSRFGNGVKICLGRLNANPNYVLPDGYAPIHSAVKSNDLEILRLMLENGGDPLLKSLVDDRETPVILAARGANDAVIKLLHKFS